MVIADFVAISLVIVFAFIGYKIGVGRVLKFATGGIIGKIISVVVCYFIYGFVLEIPFVKSLLEAFVNWISSSDSSFVKLLLYIRIDMIAYFAVLFFLVQIARKIVIALLGKIFSLAPVIDKTFGIVINLAFIVAIVLIVFQISYWVLGADGGLFPLLDGSLLGLDKLYLQNPLNSIIENLDISGIVK